MKMTRHWLRVLGIAFCLTLAPLPVPLQVNAAQAQEATTPAMAAYQDGKQRYDAGDFSGARTKFIAAIRLEPDNPRWHYNLGLTHRQLDNVQAARQSLLRARELNPDYKRIEIEQKLASMGFAPTTDNSVPQANTEPGAGTGDDSETAFVLWIVGGAFALALTVFGLIYWVIRRASWQPDSEAQRVAQTTQRGKKNAPDRAAILTLKTQLTPISNRLIEVEHALRLGENADLRSLLDHATEIEQEVHSQLSAALRGDSESLSLAKQAIPSLEETAQQAHRLAAQLHGAAAFSGKGDKLACYFCARPLANAAFRKNVLLKRQVAGREERAEVVSCPPCAAVTAQGSAPAVLTGRDGQKHWSELLDFEPYTARHTPPTDTQRLPAGQFTPQRSLADLAVLAGGAALAGGALATMLRPDQSSAAHADALSAPMLDLDVAHEASVAHEAARATAERAGIQRGQSLADHS